MTNFTTLIRQCLLAVVLAVSAFGAIAGPLSYHVSVNAGTLSGPGILDFYFSKDAAAAGATVTVSNLTGALDGPAYAIGAVTVQPDGSIVIGNGPDIDNIFGQNVQFGGMFNFDLLFSTDFLDEPLGAGSAFSVSLLNADGSPADGTDYGVALFDLVPGEGIRSDIQQGFATIAADVTAVPEPSSMLMMMTGLGLVGFTARRRKAPAQAIIAA